MYFFKSKLIFDSLILLLICLSVIKAEEKCPITKIEFVNAVVSCGYEPPSDTVNDAFANATLDFSRQEAAMFLAQIIYESMGFQYVEELACKNNNCSGNYKDDIGLKDKYYFGRGYIQISWARNYKNASEALGLGDKLLREPELVATDPNIAMQVSAWIWKINVRPKMWEHSNWFGITTKAITKYECYTRTYPEGAKRRWKTYLKVSEALCLAYPAEESGCYDDDIPTYND